MVLLLMQGQHFCAQSKPENFPVFLNLEKKGTAEQLNLGAIVYEGDEMDASIIFDEKAWDGKTKMYCYVLVYSDVANDLGVVFPQQGQPPAEYLFPKMESNGRPLRKWVLFEGVVTPPFGNDNFVVLATEKPIPDIYERLTRGDEATRENFKSELMKLVKGSKLSAFYDQSFGSVSVRTLRIESRPAEEKQGLAKGGTKKKQLFAINDSSEFFYTPHPELDIVRDSFPLIEVIDPVFETATTKGFKKLSGSAKKILLRGISVDWKRGIKKITVGGNPVNTYREASGYFDHLIEPVPGRNILEVAAENNNGYVHTVRLQFEYFPEKENVQSVGNDYLIVIGINDYNTWPKLNNASRDAKDFRTLMEDKFGFREENIKELIDKEATRKKIYSQLRDYVEHLKENDRLLIYFSGHGYYDETLDMGYWIPADASEGADDEYLGNLDITRMIQKMKAKQIFLIADACYSGQLLRDMQKSQDGNYKSRLVLCSGKLQTVLDGKPGKNSPFSTSVLEFLKSAKDQKIRATDLINHVKRTFANLPGQQPVGGAIDEVGDENGDFTFERKK